MHYDFDKAIEVIKQYDTIIIHRHSSPDGDAIGSQVGLKKVLEANFPEKKIYAVGDPAGRYSFVEGSAMDEIEDGVYQGALAILLDMGAAHLVSDNRYTLAECTLRIDHHQYVEKFTELEIVDSSRESCAGLVASLVRDWGLNLTAQAAKALYTGMVTDSGRFRYDSTSSETFKAAAYLFEQDFDAGDIYINLYSDDLDMIRLRASFVMRIELSEHGVAYIYTTADEVKALGVSEFTVSRGMVNTMAEIKGVNTWVNFTETDEGVLCELRSKTQNINQIAVKYGGGGHVKASGARVKDRETAMAMLRDLDLMQIEE
ncbi:MAG: bifunctional oligoribonuclease/PAP phosphatase NrnA [Clostridia bacterium]|nr:bifunctional oligoribonuclease/PAP phosphatase NrnA [Clostridia bacterium]